MKNKEFKEQVEALINLMPEGAAIDLSGLNLGNRDVNFSHIKTTGIISNKGQEAEVIHNLEQKASVAISNKNQKTKEIFNTNQNATHLIFNKKQNAGKIIS